MRLTPLIGLMLLAQGCTFDEHLPEVDLHGTVILPAAAATRTVINSTTGELEEVTDARFIGPVYLGAFASVNSNDFPFPHPEIGPVIGGDQDGNTYPYGGGTVGRFDFACFEDLACRVSTGRFNDFEDIIDFFGNVLNDPVVDEYGNIVDSPDYFRSYCYELLDYTADYEMAFISNADRDHDGNITEVENTLHFELNETTGNFEAEFDLWQTTFYPNMKIWGWMDAPSEQFTFSTCDPDRGQRNTRYSNDYYYGANYTDLLNYPNKYIFENDYVAGADNDSSPSVGDHADADAYRAANPEIIVNLNTRVE